MEYTILSFKKCTVSYTGTKNIRSHQKEVVDIRRLTNEIDAKIVPDQKLHKTDHSPYEIQYRFGNNGLSKCAENTRIFLCIFVNLLKDSERNCIRRCRPGAHLLNALSLYSFGHFSKMRCTHRWRKELDIQSLFWLNCRTSFVHLWWDVHSSCPFLHIYYLHALQARFTALHNFSIYFSITVLYRYWAEMEISWFKDHGKVRNFLKCPAQRSHTNS